MLEVEVLVMEGEGEVLADSPAQLVAEGHVVQVEQHAPCLNRQLEHLVRACSDGTAVWRGHPKAV